MRNIKVFVKKISRILLNKGAIDSYKKTDSSPGISPKVGYKKGNDEKEIWD